MDATPEDIRYAFRLLLGREVDESGKASFERLIAQTPMSPDQLADTLMRSAEFRSRNDDALQLLRNDLGGYSVFSRKGDALIGAHLVAGVPYEPYVMDAFDAALAGAEVVLDVGANIGIFSMRAASRLPESATVIAVEPLPQNLQALYAGIRYNGFRNLQVFPFAASDGPGLVNMICNGDSSNGILLDEGPEGYANSTAPAHRLDQLLAWLERLDVVKIDIEGHEPVAWRGMSGLLRRFRPKVFVEFSPIAIRNSLGSAEAFAGQLLDYSPRIQILHRDAESVLCESVEAIMGEWQAANRRAGMGGEMHIDLLLAPDR